MIFIFMDNILIAGQLRYLVSWKTSTWQWWMKTRLITSFVKRLNSKFYVLKGLRIHYNDVGNEGTYHLFVYPNHEYTWQAYIFNIRRGNYSVVISLQFVSILLQIWRKVNWCQKKVILYLRQTNWLNMERH